MATWQNQQKVYLGKILCQRKDMICIMSNLVDYTLFYEVDKFVGIKIVKNLP